MRTGHARCETAAAPQAVLTAHITWPGTMAVLRYVRQHRLAVKALAWCAMLPLGATRARLLLPSRPQRGARHPFAGLCWTPS